MLLRYLLAGSSLFLLDLAVFLALIRLGGTEISTAQLISRTTGAAAGFVLHKYFSFADTNAAPHRLLRQGWAYAALTIAGIALAPLVLGAAAVLTGYRVVPAKIVTEGIMICLNFVVIRHIFRPQCRGMTTE